MIRSLSFWKGKVTVLCTTWLQQPVLEKKADLYMFYYNYGRLKILSLFSFTFCDHSWLYSFPPLFCNFVLNFLIIYPRRISTFQTYREEEHVVSCRFSIGFQVIELIKLAYMSIYFSVSKNTVCIFLEMYLFEIQPQPKQSFAEVDHTSFFHWALHWHSSPTKQTALKTEA